MTEEFKASKEFHDRMRSVLREHRPNLLTIQDQIVIKFVPEAPKSAMGTERYGLIKSSPKDLSVLTDKQFSYKFTVILYENTWRELDNKGQEANLFRLLCHIGVKTDKDDNDVFFLRKPEYFYFAEELELFGVWQTDEPHSKLLDIFGKIPQLISGIMQRRKPTSAPIPTPAAAPAQSTQSKKSSPSKQYGLKPPPRPSSSPVTPTTDVLEDLLEPPPPQIEEEEEEDLSHMDLDL